MDNKLKKSKLNNIINNFNKKIVYLTNQIDFLFKNKFILQDFYIDKMNLLTDIQAKIIGFDDFINKKRKNKSIIENLINNINDSLEKICCKTGSNNCKNTLDIYFPVDEYLENKSSEFLSIFNIYNEHFIPLSSSKVIEDDKFLKKYNLKRSETPQVIKIIEFTKSNPLIEKINGASIIYFINDKIFYINGYFNNDSLNIFKNLPEFKPKLDLIENEVEIVDVPVDFKEKYIEQLSLKDFMILSPKDIAILLKSDYDEFLSYKNKSLSLLIKEFIKCNIEKQRKIIILFLISDKESQYIAHIIFDLISDKSFLSETQYLSEILFNSLHWKIQKVFKKSHEDFDNSKKKLENITINSIPYDSRILALKTTDSIKAKAMEKLKEINGSKENSIKAQQWLDGFLKIPFNVLKKEPIIDFFKNFQVKIEKYIDLFTIRISEFDYDQLNNKNQNIYDIIIQIINEFHGAVYKSENSYNSFIKYLELVRFTIKNEIVYDDNFDYKVIENITMPDEDTINECIDQLSYFKKIKNELYDSDIINKNNLEVMIKKLDELESMLNINVDNEEDELNMDDYNDDFKKLIYQNLSEFDQFIKEWNDFKLKKKNYMLDVDKILDKCTYGQTDAKKQMKRIIGQWMNGASKGQCFGLCGPPGVGKTTLCKNGLAKCLFDENGEARPFAFLPLGGATNGSILEGHHYTYLGSTWGKIVDILMETKCMNPIIYIDELDKISKTEHGKEITSILTHITDQSQNKEYFDRYFASVPIDLSQVLFIFSYNDRDNIDKILRDRIQEIDIKPLSVKEKLVISDNYIIPEILNNVGFCPSEIIMDQTILTTIINEYTYEAGVRKLNEILYDIVRDINLKKITQDEKSIKYPIVVNNDFIKDLLSNLPKMTIKKIHDVPKVGLVNGLYATQSGLGGLTIIQAMKVFSEKKFSLEKLTGNQGDVMKESMTCAMTLSWNLLPQKVKDEINEMKDGFGIHIHCPDGGTPKDGPSAGLAITMAIVSRFTNIPVRNDLALTGEVDLIGNAKQIGGLYSKLVGAHTSGVKTVLIPRENKNDLDIILKKEAEENKNVIKSSKSKLAINQSFKELDENKDNRVEDENKVIFRNNMEIILVDTIYDVLKYGLMDNNIEFNKDF
jgi:endopeptidase La